MQWAAKLSNFSLRVSLPLTVVALLMLASDGWCQQELRSGKKGATSPAPVTSTSVDADTQALDVAIKAGSITLSGADGATLDGANSAIRATVFDRTNSNPVATQLVDSNGDPVSVGGGTQYSQGTTATDTDQLMLAGCVRADTAAVPTGVIDGDRVRCIVDSAGLLWVRAAQSGTWNIGTLTSITNAVAVTGTFWQATQPVSAASLPLPTGAATLAEQQTQTTALQLIDNLPLAQGATTSGQNGVLTQGAVTTAAPTYTTGNTNPISLQTDGSQRVAVTNTPSVAQSGTWNINSVTTLPALPANQSVNVAQINGVTPLMGAGNTGTGSHRVTIATDQAALNGLGIYVEDAGETAGGNLAMVGSVRRDTAASSAGTTGDNATINTDATGLLWTRTIDPCSSTAKTFAAINISTATTTEITPSLAGASTNYYICSLVLVTAAANNIALVDDDTDNCTSVTSGLAGGTTSGSGFNMAANSGMTFGNGMGSVFKTAGTNRVVCLVTSAATQLSGTMAYVAAP